jgi:hypothetical protein
MLINKSDTGQKRNKRRCNKRQKKKMLEAMRLEEVTRVETEQQEAMVTARAFGIQVNQEWVNG